MALLVLLIGNSIAAYRWSLVMRTIGAPKAMRFYFRTLLTGLMFNQLLPSSIGGDGYRMMETTKLGISKRLSITGVLSDRIIGFCGLIMLSVITLPAASRLLPHNIFLLVLAIIACCTAAIVGIYSLRFIKIAFFETYFRWLYDLSHTFATSFTSISDLLKKLAFSIATNFSAILSFYLIAVSLSIPCHAIDFMLIIPLVTLLMMIPISMAGWGIRESAMVYLGAMVGLTHPAALAISLLNGLALIINSIPGFYFYFIRPRKPQTDKLADAS